MSVDLTAGIVRILTPEGATAGTGFVVADEGLIATCAHVVKAAGAGPGDSVRVVFYSTGEGREARVEPEWWRASDAGDVAILRLEGDSPQGMQLLPLGPSISSKGHVFETCGFPRVIPDDVILGAGEILGETILEGLRVLQLRSPEVTSGFSGAPVWDRHTGRVVGIVTSITPPDEYRRLAATAFATPTDVLVEVCSELECVSPAAAALLGKLSNVPGLPPRFLPRPEYLEPLKASVLADMGKPVAVTGTTRKVGVQGMGGIGKSVLAAALARDLEVRRAFPDGVLWLTVGQEPGLTLRQSQLVKALGDNLSAFEDVQQGRARLSELLASKVCLLVLDDVWKVEHTEAFDALGPRSRMLITTRDAGLITALGAVEHRIDVLDEDQSLQLLASWAEEDVEALPPEAHEVARECGRLPLALAMTGAIVRSKPDRWRNVLNRLRNANLAKIQRQFSDYPYPDLLQAIQASVDALPSGVQECYLDLAVFPEGTPIPEAVLVTLWAPEGLDEFDVEDVIDALVERSLAQCDEAGRISLHDLQWDYIRKQTRDLPALHGRLLHAYQALCQNGWPAGPDDGYFFQHLAYHLVEAGRQEELRLLLFDFDWLRNKLDAADTAALIADYDVALTVPAPFASGHMNEIEDRSLRLVRGALRLAAHILAQDKTQLAGQLWGRLAASRSAEVRALLKRIKKRQSAPWLRPLTPSLVQPGGSLLRTLAGHTDWVNAVAVVSDGRWIISASGDCTLKVWDMSSGAEQCTLSGHTGWVKAVAVSPDGQRVISAAADNTLRVWDLKRGSHMFTLSGHTDKVWDVALTPDGQWAISASWDRTLKVWDLGKGTELRTLKGHIGRVRAVAVTPDGRWAISGSDDGALRVWDLKLGAEVRTLKGHASRVNALAVTPDGQQIVSGSGDCTLKVWDLKKGVLLHTLTGHKDWISTVAVTPNGQQIVSGSGDCTLKVWDLEKGGELHTMSDHGAWILSVAVTPDGRWIISASADHTLKIWDLDRMREYRAPTGHMAGVRGVAVIPDGRQAVSASRDGTMKMWDLEHGSELCTLDHGNKVLAVAVIPDGARAVSAFPGGLKVWDLSKGSKLRTLTGHRGRVLAVAVTPDGRWAISASADCTLKVWDLGKWSNPRTLTGHIAGVVAVAALPDGRRVISASSDCTLRVWDIMEGKELCILTGCMAGINAVAVTPDGRCAISGSEDGALKVWDLELEVELQTLTAHTAGVRAVCVTSDGQRAVSTSADHTLKVWDLRSGAIVASFTGSCELTACAVASDGKHIVVGQQSGQVHFLYLEGA